LEPLGLSLYKYPISNQDDSNPLVPKSGSGEKRGDTKSLDTKKKFHISLPFTRTSLAK
jgi:hypothetical protein